MPYAVVHLKERRILRQTIEVLTAWLAITLATDRSDYMTDGLGKRKRMTDDIDDIIIAAAYLDRCDKRLRTDHTFEYEPRSLSLGNPVTHMEWGPHKFREEFRFDRSRFLEVLAALRLPALMRTECGHAYTGEEGLLIYLNRLHRPITQGQLSDTFGKSQCEISFILKDVSEFIYHEHKHVLTDLQRWEFLFDHFAERIHHRTNRLKTVIGFVDGKLWATCRPVRNQRDAYNGHKKHHGIKNQSVIFPNGMIGHYWGPMNGNRHDSHMLRCSGLVAALRACCARLGIANPSYCVYGDPAYPLSDVVSAPWKGLLNAEREAFNADMSSSRVTVEWGFGVIVTNWPWIDFRQQMKILESNVQAHVSNAVLFTNLLSICNDNSCVAYFKCNIDSNGNPVKYNLTLDEYLHR